MIERGGLKYLRKKGERLEEKRVIGIKQDGISSYQTRQFLKKPIFQWQLVNEVYPDKETMEKEVKEWNILPKSAVALKFATSVVKKRFDERLKEDLKYFESIYLNELMKTHDGKEGLSSFLEKRKPVWKDE